MYTLVERFSLLKFHFLSRRSSQPILNQLHFIWSFSCYCLIWKNFVILQTGSHRLRNTSFSCHPPFWMNFICLLKGRYGTRSISALTVKSDWEMSFYERHLEDRAWKDKTVTFTIETEDRHWSLKFDFQQSLSGTSKVLENRLPQTVHCGSRSRRWIAGLLFIFCCWNGL